MITSRQNERIKSAIKLRTRREREKQSRFLIDGAREILRALAAKVPVLEAFVCESLCESGDSREAWARLVDQQANVAPVTEEVFEKLAFGARAEGVVAVARLEQRPLSELAIEAESLVCIAEGIEKPGNLGAILRTADAAGVAALIVTGGGTDLWNPNTIRASLGTLFTVPVFATDNATALAWLRAGKFQIFTARVDGSIPYTKANFTGRTAMVLGSEANGLSAQWHDASMQAIRLPMLGTADSLNVSATASVLFYEALRQCTQSAAADSS